MEVNSFYKCEFCGNIVQLINDGGGDMYCCGEIMVEIPTKLTDAGNEKHVPVVNIDGSKLIVKIGEIDHPMIPTHYIQWIEVRQGEYVQRKYLKHDDKPIAEYDYLGGKYSVYSMCNIHGLWMTQSK